MIGVNPLISLVSRDPALVQDLTGRLEALGYHVVIEDQALVTGRQRAAASDNVILLDLTQIREVDLAAYLAAGFSRSTVFLGTTVDLDRLLPLVTEGPCYIMTKPVQDRDLRWTLSNIVHVLRTTANLDRQVRNLNEEVRGLRQVAENIPLAFTLWDMDLERNIYVSPSFERVWGHLAEEIIQDPRAILKYVHLEDRDKSIEFFYHSNQRQTVEVEYRIVGADGQVRWLSHRTCPIMDQTGRVYRVVNISQDITHHKLAEQALRESEKNLRGTMNAIPEAIFLMEVGGTVLEANEALARRLHLTRTELIGANIYSILPPSLADTRKLQAEKVIRSKRPLVFQDRRDQAFMAHSVSPIFDEAGEVSRIAVLVWDITDRIKAEEALRTSEEKFRHIFEQSPLGIMLFGQDGVIIDCNDNFVRIIGASRSVLIGFNMLKSMPAGPARQAVADALVHGSGFFEGDYKSVTGGQDMTIRAHHRTITTIDGRFLTAIGVFEDITERKKAENKLRAALAEKEVLIKEVHHRVKNNLQVIISLLNMQSRTSADESVTQALRESRDRIQAMAIIHESLYKSSDLALINLKSYVPRLAKNILASVKGHGKSPLLDLDIIDVQVSLEQAVPCGLIINELITNALKYARPSENGKLKITVKARVSDQNHLEIAIQDNGQGLPEGLDLDNPQSMGLKLVNVLIHDQLQGQLRVDNNNGCHFYLKWPLSGQADS